MSSVSMVVQERRKRKAEERRQRSSSPEAGGAIAPEMPPMPGANAGLPLFLQNEADSEPIQPTPPQPSPQPLEPDTRQPAPAAPTAFKSQTSERLKPGVAHSTIAKSQPAAPADTASAAEKPEVKPPAAPKPAAASETAVRRPPEGPVAIAPRQEPAPTAPAPIEPVPSKAAKGGASPTAAPKTADQPPLASQEPPTAKLPAAAPSLETTASRQATSSPTDTTDPAEAIPAAGPIETKALPSEEGEKKTTESAIAPEGSPATPVGALGKGRAEPAMTPEKAASETAAPEGGAIATGGPTQPAGGEASASAPAAEGGEVQGGNEEEGAAELEEKLANADPGRAATDEADPADVAQGEAEATETTAATPPTETLPPPASLAEPASLPLANEATEASPEPAPEATVPEMEETSEKAALAAPSAAMPSPAPVTEPTPEPEEPAAADGFSGDEPALGGGATEDMGAADLSPAEQQAALSTIGESAGGGGDGGGGGGGGSAIPDTPPPETLKVAEAEPTAALAQIGHLPPAQLQQSLGEVGKAVTKSTQDKRTELAANPPQIERPTGSPKNLQGDQTAIPIVDGKPQGKVEKAPEGEAIPIAPPAPLPELPPSPAERIPEPVVSGGEGGELSQKDVTQLSNSMESLPVHDAGLNVPKQPPPQVALAGNADPTKTDEQRQKLQASVAETATQGRHDVAQEMGENTKIYPSVPPEKITAKVPAGEAAAGAKAAPMAEGSIEPEALSAIAQQEKGGEIQAAVGQAQQTMAAKKDEYNTQVADEKAKSNKEIADLEAKSAADQSQVRAAAQASVTAKKQQWNTEQTKAVQTANQQADDEVAKGRKEVQSKKQEADRQAAEQIDQGNQEAESEREKAEKTAAEEKAKGEKESEGFFGWLASKAKAFFNKIKAAIKSAFDYARKKIKQAVEAAKKAAMAAIDLARNAIVTAIKAVGNALIAIGDKLLAGFPGLRDKFRKAIQNTVDAAVKKVNEYADQLKKGVAAALDVLAAGLDKLAGWLEKGLLAAVDGLAAVVDGAIKFADKVAQAVGAFAALIKDVAAGPIAWLKNLGSGVVDGIKNHLWKAFKEAVKEWFNSKLEQVLGLGSMVWNLIKGGGLALAEVGKMAWEGIKALIPPTLIRILVEKLVAMIVPAAGALMVIIEGLQAAWGTVQRIIAAFQKFFAFLKAVKAGNAGPAFAVALAAAAIAVIDFVANWLILKLAKGAAKIGGKIKGLAKKILGRKKGKAAGKKAKAKAKDKTKTKTAAKKPTTPKQPTKKPAAKKSTKGKDKKADRKKDQDRKKQDRLDKAVKAIQPQLTQMISRGVKGIRLKAQLLLWRLKYRLSKLYVEKQGERLTVIAAVNPQSTIIQAGQNWELRIAGTRVGQESKSSIDQEKRAKALQSGSAWETASNPLITGELANELFGTERYRIVPKLAGSRKIPSSSVKTTSLVGQVQTHHGEEMRKPDWRAEQMRSTHPGKELDTLHLIEQTLVLDWTVVSDKFSRHKADQFYHTLLLMIQRYQAKYPNSFKIVYHIIASDKPPSQTKKLILDTVKSLQKNFPGVHILVVWRIT